MTTQVIPTLCVVITFPLVNTLTALTQQAQQVLASTESIPYQASLRFQNLHFCSGAIVNNKSIVTTASCCLNNGRLYPVEYITVVIGNPNIITTSSSEVKLKVEKIIIHENYEGNLLSNNIAILQTENIILNWTEDIQPISIPTEFAPINTKCSVFGWGTVAKKFPMIETLGKDNVLTESCTSDFDDQVIYYDNQLICSNFVINADYGSPMARNLELLGLFVYSTCDKGAFMNIVNYKEWLKNNMVPSKGYFLKHVYINVMFISICYYLIDVLY